MPPVHPLRMMRTEPAPQVVQRMFGLIPRRNKKSGAYENDERQHETDG
jgi:hypothetical protein